MKQEDFSLKPRAYLQEKLEAASLKILPETRFSRAARGRSACGISAMTAFSSLQSPSQLMCIKSPILVRFHCRDISALPLWRLRNPKICGWLASSPGEMRMLTSSQSLKAGEDHGPSSRQVKKGPKGSPLTSLYILFRPPLDWGSPPTWGWRSALLLYQLKH